jgi:hypothetical protein
LRRKGFICTAWGWGTQSSAGSYDQWRAGSQMLSFCQPLRRIDGPRQGIDSLRC